MKKLHLLFAGAFAALALVACSDDEIEPEPEPTPEPEPEMAYITLSAEEFEFYKTGGEAEVTVESNYEWSYEYESDWLTVSKNTDGSLTVTVNANGTGKGREGTVTVTAGDGAANVAEAYLTITQVAFGPDDFVLEYTIETDGTEIQLPLGVKDSDGNVFTIDCTANWGDDSEEQTVTGSWPSHTYSEAGTYTVIINGTVELLSSWDYDKSEDNGINGLECLTAVKQWGETGLGSMDRAFYYCTNLASLPEGPGPFSNVASFSYAFAHCESLATVPEDIFSGCTATENFGHVFADCYKLTSAPSFKGLSKATNFSCVFCNCTSLTTVPEDMFSGCTAAENFMWAFYGCYGLSSAPSFKGLSSATDFYAVCWNCYINTIPEDMFSGCTAAKEFEYAFGGCYALTTVPERLFADCTAVESFEGVFTTCEILETVPVGIFDNNTSVTDFLEAFENCSSLTGESPYTMIDGNKVHLYERENYPDHFTAPTEYERCFSGCVKLDDYDSIPSGWGGDAN